MWRSRLIGALSLTTAGSNLVAYLLSRSTVDGTGLSQGWLATASLGWLALSGWAILRRRVGVRESVAMDVVAIGLLTGSGVVQPPGPWTWLSAVCIQLVPTLAVISLRGRWLLVVGAVACIGISVLVQRVEAPALLSSFSTMAMVLLTIIPVTTIWILAGKLDEVTGRAQRAATTDELTRLLNRYGLKRSAGAFLARATAQGSQLCVVVADLDHFKSINDRYGHGVGDDVLSAAAAALRTASRTDDLVVRFGGEEMAILTPVQSVQGALTAAERLRQAVEDVDIAGLPRITASFGVAVADTDAVRRAVETDEEDAISTLIADLMESADAALYSAKEAGRNRVCVALSDA